MGLFSCFKRTGSDSRPRIRTEKDVKAFWLDATKDDALSQFLVGAIMQVGRDGYLMVERGGNGRPYSAEYQPCPEDNRRAAEVQAELQSLRRKRAAAQTDTERDRLERKAAEVAGGVCTIRINTTTSDDFNRLRDLIIDTWAKFKEATKDTAI